MSKKREKQKTKPAPRRTAGNIPCEESLRKDYEHACRLADQGQVNQARKLYEQLEKALVDVKLKALVVNDLATLAMISGETELARVKWRAALVLDPSCVTARANLADLDSGSSEVQEQLSQSCAPDLPHEPPVESGRIRVAILSFLFNWPSTGGGIIHTIELARFLRKAGFQVRHIYACYPAWGVGQVKGDLPFPSESLEFNNSSWNISEIQSRFHAAVQQFDPSHVIITDSWNSKPILAEAVRPYPYILRLQAMECLCPLNNVRLLADGDGHFRQCPRHQLATPEECMKCLQKHGHRSGSLHKAERALCGVGTQQYHDRLVRAFRDAEAVLVVNPLHEAMVSPYTECVRVVTAGMDPDRFPWPPIRETRGSVGKKLVVFFAGLVEETIKGFKVVHDACARLWAIRNDFELVATGDPPGQVDEFTRYIGWQSQEDLPRQLQEAEMLVMPTIAQEALGRTAVEAMASGIPVIASRLGGLPFTVTDGATGLLFEPGNCEELASKIEKLLDDPDLRWRLGQTGRRRFEESYSWPVIIERHYRPLLKPRGQQSSVRNDYHPFILERVDQDKLIEEMVEFFELPRHEIEKRLRTYRAFHESKRYAQTLGECKTLCFEEAFVLYVLLGKSRPKRLVEIGTQYGKSTRRLLDIIALLGLDARMICFDVENQVQHFQSSEADLILKDVTGRFAKEVLAAKPEFIYLDVHSYSLLKEALTEMHACPRRCALAIHDCGKGLCNPRMELSINDPHVSSLTGIWERHVLAEVFGLDDPLSDRLDNLKTETHHLRIFTTPHGLGVMVPTCLAEEKK